ncbi:hypothetical protein [Clostridium sp. YIM B02569]|uniref:hypothetical protein n=1 Tax=Clostridium sp. YIM B02569 TaxID=2911967 RepID=UPI001EEB553C|nr:hypothetical protein [Clostridium sp. YIM B02569]
MKRVILSLVMSLIVISSFGAEAATRQSIQENKSTGWFYVDETNNEGYFVNGVQIINKWLNLNGKWYFFKEDGSRAKGWLELNNNWYYLNSEGAMETGWVKDNNKKWYYLNSDGIMAHDTYIGNYHVGSDGVWIK